MPGCCGGDPTTKKIDDSLKKDKKTLEREVKLLLLGAGESGKSTVAKQMRIIFLEGFSELEKRGFREVIRLNMITSMRSLITGAQKLNITIQKAEAAESFLESTQHPTEITQDMQKEMAQLWDDEGIKEAFKKSNRFQLSDSTEYYYLAFERIMSSDYIPTEQDILRSRAKTTGIIETEFDVDQLHFKLVDVGGQRSERKKWIHCFSEVTAVVFFVALSEYDLKLYEDEAVNRMDESAKIFEEICRYNYFKKTPIILFLNKSDIFAEKIKTSPLKNYFPDYNGGADFDQATAYIQKFFEEKKGQTKKDLYFHVTNATNTQNIQFVFNAVKDILLKKILLAGGVL